MTGPPLLPRFIGLKMKSVTFEDSLFEECYFEDITSSNTFFKNCTFISTVFYNTGGPGGPCAGVAEMGVTPPTPFLVPPDLFEYKFINSRVLNSTFLHNKEGCQLDFSDDNNAYMIYFVSFLGTLAVLPGNIVSALLMDKIGRLRMLGGCWVLGAGWVLGGRCQVGRGSVEERVQFGEHGVTRVWVGRDRQSSSGPWAEAPSPGLGWAR